MKEKDLNLLLDTCLLTGKIMMKSNADMSRIEETMSCIVSASGDYQIVTYAIQTGLFIGLEHTSMIRMEQVMMRATNLEIVTEVNELLHQYIDNKLTLLEFYNELQILEKKCIRFPTWLQIISAAIISATLMFLFGGLLEDFPVTLFIGGVGYTIYLLGEKLFHIKFLSEFLSSIFIGLAAILSVKLGIGNNSDCIIIGCIMPLVPGVQITNSIRDLLAGHYMSGISKGVEAMITATMIGFAISFVFQACY